MKKTKKQFFSMEAVACILTLITGTLLHFFYEWTGSNFFAGLIAPVNESVWEHLKLLFFPVLILSFFEYVIFDSFPPSFLFARTMGILAGMGSILTFFYTYTGILGTNYLWLDIFSFFLGVFITYRFTWYLSFSEKRKKTEAGCRSMDMPWLLLLLLCAVLFFYFTENPPKINLFVP